MIKHLQIKNFRNHVDTEPRYGVLRMTGTGGKKAVDNLRDFWYTVF
jgi:hypothetical protein